MSRYRTTPILVVLTLAVAMGVLAGLGLVDRQGAEEASTAGMARSRSTAPRFATEPETSSAPRDSAPVGVGHEPSAQLSSASAAIGVLRGWDRGRARAYARGDVAALRASYTKGSLAGTSDVALLRDYQRRGLRVEGLRMQLLAVEVLADGPVRLRLRVTDRVHGAVAVGPGSHIELPRDQASMRVVTMTRVSASAHWKVAAVAEP